MLNDLPVIDAVVHAFNFTGANFRNQYGSVFADRITRASMLGPEGFVLDGHDEYRRNWSIDDAARVAFAESQTDLAAYHVLPIMAFRDGACSIEKAVRAKQKWPHRFAFYIGVDAMSGAAALDEMDRQFDMLEGDAVGVKLYPNSWLADEITGWKMDNPEIAFPIFEKARKMGLKAVAIHKALPLGQVELDHYRVDDIDRAAIEFPELNFEIVHGGMAFVEETMFQIRRFPNVYVNLESTSSLLTIRPAQWERVMAQFMQSDGMRKKILWGTGGLMVIHPRAGLEAFQRFRFRQETIEGEGIAQISDDDRRDMLANNFVRMTGIDMAARLAACENDEFSQARRQAGGMLPPFSTAPTASSPQDPAVVKA
ncbi:amidohydrolase family protein [Rhizorhabdus wittichii]|jgi:predicted TIM-barrel fold metal-dependent hydrolase|uniref:Amidohydrolase family protein n=1 Tax=Rhizorhabdus wittichii TaxID=160791 RepID=A0A975HCE3_9SPHN|nr:amidohydrolase family protein [Rhizorhabdus wittichii]QTH20281.1 amidohydrolase family protein [Rhizorhabdus wittichii]